MRNVARIAVVLAAVLGVGGYGSSAPVSRDRIMGPVDAARVASVRGTAHPRARAQFDHGHTDPRRMISGAITFRLSGAQQADLDKLLREQQDRTSPNYHRWITPDQYAARFGMSSNDLAKVTSWLQSQGLTVDSISRNRNEVSFSGSVGQIEYALKTELHNYTIHGEQHFANALDVSLPSAFSAQVLGVRGLDNFSPKPRLHKAKPQFTSSISGNHFVIPGDFATIYNVSPLYTQGLDGAGQKIAVVGQTNISLTDVDSFRAAAGLPKYDPTILLVPNTGAGLTCSSSTTGDEGEADLDVEWSGAVAKNANIIYVYAGVGTGGTCNSRTKNVFDALSYAVTNNVAPVISISYGNCEANLSTFVQTARQWAQQANAQGQTISGPSGDDGAADCDNNVSSAISGLAVDVPAAIPEVTGVGGSEFTGDSTQCPGTPPSCPGSVAPADPPYWGGSSSPTSGASALTYIPETSWNDTSASIAAGHGFSATGGGASTVFTKPTWQTGQGVPNDGKRDVPDIALNASSGHDSYLFCTEGSCTNGFRDSSGNLSGVGGTSAGAPTFAGILAIINEATQSASGQGNVNPSLYALASSTPSAFHDIGTGNNKVPCTTGSINCPSGTTSIGFSAGTGYDQVTGLGSVNAFNLITAWPGFSSTQGFALGTSPSAISIASAGQGGSATAVAGGTNGFSGTVSLACSVSSTTAGIGCSISPSSLTLDTANTSQTATITITTAAASASLGSRRFGLYAATALFPGMLLLGVPALRRRTRLLSLLVLIAIVGSLASCGGGSSTTPPPTQTTPAGTYTITVTGTSGSTSHSTNVSLTVQ